MVILNPWVSTFKVWIVFCLGKNFLIKSILTGCEKCPLVYKMTSLAMFQNTNVTLSSFDPYNNTLGEENWLVIVLVICSVIYCIFGMFLAYGIIVFEKYGLNPGNRQLVDMVRLCVVLSETKKYPLYGRARVDC